MFCTLHDMKRLQKVVFKRGGIPASVGEEDVDVTGRWMAS